MLVLSVLEACVAREPFVNEDLFEAIPYFFDVLETFNNGYSISIKVTVLEKLGLKRFWNRV